VAYQNNLEEHLLVNLHEFLVPLINIGGFATVIVIVTGRGGVVLVVVAPLDNFLEDGLVDLENSEHKYVKAGGVNRKTHVRDGNSLAGVTQILKHVLD
jgi:hypothetical protein